MIVDPSRTSVCKSWTGQHSWRILLHCSVHAHPYFLHSCDFSSHLRRLIDCLGNSGDQQGFLVNPNNGRILWAFGNSGRAGIVCSVAEREQGTLITLVPRQRRWWGYIHLWGAWLLGRGVAGNTSWGGAILWAPPQDSGPCSPVKQLDTSIRLKDVKWRRRAS